MSIEDYFAVGRRVELGTHRFESEAIKAFARKYDPQPFHLDEEAGRNSVFGGLCASGWHTAAAWMKANIASPRPAGEWTGTGHEPVFGPSPGITGLRWLKPVMAGETVAFSRTVNSIRPLSSRPGWAILSARAEGHDSAGDKVIEFDTAAMVKVDLT